MFIRKIHFSRWAKLGIHQNSCLGQEFEFLGPRAEFMEPMSIYIEPSFFKQFDVLFKRFDGQGRHHMGYHLNQIVINVLYFQFARFNLG